MQLRNRDVPFTGLTEEFAFEEVKFFTQLLRSSALLPYGMLSSTGSI